MKSSGAQRESDGVVATAGGVATSPLRDTTGYLPIPTGTLVGRQEAMKAVATVLATGRLVTLTGAPGIGKTRLAVEAAARVAGDNKEGCCFVDLAIVANADQIAPAVLVALGMADPPGSDADDTLRAQLGTREMLMVLDNCEHIVAAAAALVEGLLSDCAGLRILATCREPLGIAEEVVWRVPPLSIPPDQASAVDQPGRYESVQLFCDRARAIDPGFAPDGLGWCPIVELCRRLDGIPLAIELAAARAGSLSPAEILARLDDRLGVLDSDSRAPLPRHQTLRAALDWSYALLSPAEQRLLIRMAVFPGSFSLDTVEHVGRFDDDAVITADSILLLLESLLAKSLVVTERQGEQTRYRLLETVRAYARERVREAGEWDRLAGRFAGWCCELGERADAGLTSAAREAWLDLLSAEHDNLRAAWEWMVSEGDHARMLKLAGALPFFWLLKQRWAEGWDWLSSITDATAAFPDSPERARALWARGMLATQLGFWELGRPALEEALVIARSAQAEMIAGRCLMMLATGFLYYENSSDAIGRGDESSEVARRCGDTWCVIQAMTLSGSARLMRGDVVSARATLDEAVHLARQVDDAELLILALNSLGDVATNTGDFAAADVILAEACEAASQLRQSYAPAFTTVKLGRLAHRRGDYAQARSLFQTMEQWGRDNVHYAVRVHSMNGLGNVALALGDLDEAERLFDQVLSLAWKAGQHDGGALIGQGWVALAREQPHRARRPFEEAVALALDRGWMPQQSAAAEGLGWTLLAQGDVAGALRSHSECLARRLAMGFRPTLADALEAVAASTGAVGRHEDAACLLGAAWSLRESGPYRRSPASEEQYRHIVESVRQALGAESFTESWRRGVIMSPADAAREAGRRSASLGGPDSSGRWSSLTQAELNVAKLTAEGLTNREIAARLFVSAETVKGHLAHIFAKLGIASRRELMRLVLTDCPWRHAGESPNGR